MWMKLAKWQPLVPQITAPARQLIGAVKVAEVVKVIVIRKGP